MMQELYLKEVDKTLNRWSANTKLTPKYMFYVDSYVLASKKCKNRKIWINKDLARHGDLQFLMNNEH
jgi:hypothetical protein